MCIRDSIDVKIEEPYLRQHGAGAVAVVQQPVVGVPVGDRVVLRQLGEVGEDVERVEVHVVGEGCVGLGVVRGLDIELQTNHRQSFLIHGEGPY